MSGKGGNGSELTTLITGGAGFVGCNLADRLASDGRRVRVFDDLSRPGVELNLEWLQGRHGERIEFVRGDVRDREAVDRAVDGVGQVYHFAAQVAVTTSLDDPVADFETNLRGTLNVLEAIRARRVRPGLVLTSTNKVYGGLEDVTLARRESRYLPEEPTLRGHGIDESRPLDFHSPYGCSKGGADQYALDYSRCMGLETVVFRMSCIYGPRQFGNEDQGWVAHFLLRALRGEPITIYGDGRQVRDVLFVDDLVDAFLAAEARLGELSGQAFNVGGGPANAISLRDLLDLVEELTGRAPEVEWSEWRPGDQRWYVSDPRRLGEASGWRPTVGVRDGVGRLYRWLESARPDRQLAGERPSAERLAGTAFPPATAAGEGAR